MYVYIDITGRSLSELNDGCLYMYRYVCIYVCTYVHMFMSVCR